MSFTFDLQMAPRMGLDVSPALVMFGEMLVLPYAGMVSALEDELADNPALVRLEAGECPVCHGVGRTRRCPVCSAPAGPPAAGTAWCTGVPDTADVEDDSRSLRRAVRLEVSSTDAPVAEYLVDSLDEHGHFDRPPQELAEELGVDEATVRRVTGVIQHTGPPGVGASSVAECLLLQLDEVAADPETCALARIIITDHLPALARGHLSSIAAALDVPRPRVDAALELIRHHLRPHPAFHGRTPPRPTYVVPDVVVRASLDADAPFTVELVEPAILRVRVRRPDATLAADPGGRHGDDEGRAPDRTSDESVRRAHAFVLQLHDRWDTLRRVVELAVDRQHGFLLRGPAALRPLTRAEVASALALHESTVSRAVADKFVLLPDRSVVPLSRFFGASGGLDAELRRLMDTAPGPVSDQRLADQLTEAGFPVARRTVAKHRARLGITSTLLR